MHTVFEINKLWIVHEVGEDSDINMKFLKIEGTTMNVGPVIQHIPVKQAKAIDIYISL